MTESEIFNYAIRHYFNPSCVTAEQFNSDLNITRQINRILEKRGRGEVVDLRLLLNYFMTMFNVFDNEACVRIIFIRVPAKFHAEVKTFIEFLNYLPDDLSDINISLGEIPFDDEIVKFLRGI